MKKGLLFVAAFVAVGCAPKESLVVGHWKGEAKLSEANRKVPLSNLANGFAGAMSLNVKPDHTFDMTAVLMPIAGTWSMAGNRVTFIPNEVFGFKSADKAANNPFTLELSPDGKSLRPIEKASSQDWLYFSKEAL